MVAPAIMRRCLSVSAGAARPAAVSVPLTRLPAHLACTCQHRPQGVYSKYRRHTRRHVSSNIQVASASSIGSPASTEELSNSDVPANQQGFRHAILHDFCMSIPYGSVVLAAGLVSLLFGSGRKGIMFALGGAFMLAGAFFSLLQWRQHRPSTIFTLASAGVTATLAWGFWGLVDAGISTVPNLVMFVGSMAMLVFLIYNIIAGGNPPKKTTAEDDEELAAAAAAS